MYSSVSILLQFNFGEDGLDILRTPYLNQKQFQFLIENRVSKHRGKGKGAFDQFGIDITMNDYEEVSSVRKKVILISSKSVLQWIVYEGMNSEVNKEYWRGLNSLI